MGWNHQLDDNWTRIPIVRNHHWRLQATISVTIYIHATKIVAKSTRLKRHQFHQMSSWIDIYCRLSSDSSQLKVKDSTYKTDDSDTSDWKWRQPKIHPGNITWNLKISPWKRKVHLETMVFRFHVQFQGWKPQSLPFSSMFLWLRWGGSHWEHRFSVTRRRTNTSGSVSAATSLENDFMMHPKKHDLGWERCLRKCWW